MFSNVLLCRENRSERGETTVHKRSLEFFGGCACELDELPSLKELVELFYFGLVDLDAN